MATRSLIGIKNSNPHLPGEIDYIYCHWDGYLENNGKILLENYTDPFKLQKLIDTGDLSSLAPEIGEKHDFDNPVEGVCTFYGRDRGETGVDAVTSRILPTTKESSI
jgi:hypothetical protein